MRMKAIKIRNSKVGGRQETVTKGTNAVFSMKDVRSGDDGETYIPLSMMTDY